LRKNKRKKQGTLRYRMFAFPFGMHVTSNFNLATSIFFNFHFFFARFRDSPNKLADAKLCELCWNWMQ